MRLVTFLADGAEGIGAVLGDAVVPLRPALAAALREAGEGETGILPADMVALLALIHI